MERTLMVRSLDSAKEVRNFVRYIVRLFRSGKRFSVKVFEKKPQRTLFEKLGGIPPDWEEK